jgi:hypothetical protein
LATLELIIKLPTIMSWNSDADHCKADYDNHSDQCNPNNDEYWHSRED